MIYKDYRFLIRYLTGTSRGGGARATCFAVDLYQASGQAGYAG